MLTIDDVEQAAKRIDGKIIRTPTVESPGLSQMLDRNVVLKLENLQHGGSFKQRGVLNKLLSLSDDQRRLQLAAVSGGNFGIAMAEAGRSLDLAVTIILPVNAPKSSAMRIEDAGAKVLWEPDVSAALARGATLRSQGYLLIDDCDDPLIAAGSGTIAKEMLVDHPDLTDVFAAVGGGSMISGVATALKQAKPEIRVWGVETQGADSMAAALECGQPTEIAVTSVISTLGLPKVATVFLEHVQRLVERVVVVPDRAAFESVVAFAHKGHIWVEPAAGTLLPAARQIVPKLPEDAVIGFIVCGGNAVIDDIDAFLSGNARRV